MGMYTKINIILPLKDDVSQDILVILEKLFDGYSVEDFLCQEIKLPKHRFFECPRVWFINSGGSYYFTGTANSKMIYDDLCKRYVLHIDTDFKNYDDEITYFLDWISPYVDCDDNEFLGYSRYEEDTNPILYYFIDGKICRKSNVLEVE